MQLGLVGLGRMGAGIAERLRRAGHEVVGFDADPARSDVPSLAALIDRLETPRALWLMLPSGEPTEHALLEALSHLSPGDVLIEGANSNFHDSVRRAQLCAERGVEFVDAGVSGGIWGLEVGFCLMVGGTREAVSRVEPLFRALAPEGGYAHVGAAGAGHYTKMVHNGIEYAMLQAYGEGFELLAKGDFELDLHQVAALWNHGSVVRSWLLELAERALAKDPQLEGLRGYVEDSGEGRWTVLEAVNRGVPAGVIAQSLFARFSSRDDNALSMRLIAALRNEFGGHAVQASPRP
ncbi:MAG: decarboxylating 6-phosphogluconate dehydrogenase [Dehalococcoidia bacterium]|nr:decarboxylating 6-phosphogluconate dehydrogenase [Dehalococcoidia bacterium]